MENEYYDIEKSNVKSNIMKENHPNLKSKKKIYLKKNQKY